jgi:predicted alpha/beta hydrolase family esterase
VGAHQIWVAFTGGGSRRGAWIPRRRLQVVAIMRLSTRDEGQDVRYDGQSMAIVLLVPGLSDSGPDHWQRQWQRTRGFGVIEQREWETPACADWVARIEEVVGGTTGPIVLAAHSAGCTAVTAWSATSGHAARVRGALLVAPSDTEGPNYPVGPRGFAPMRLQPLTFPSVVALSSDDPYVTVERGRAFAAAWGSDVVELGPAGHINAAAGYGPWPDGLALIDRWMK